MKGNTQVIDNPDALTRLSVLPGKRTPGAGRIVIGDPGLDEQRRRDFAERLNRRYYACGCAEGAIGVTVGVAVVAVVLALGGVGWSSAALIAVPIAGLLVGKVAGLVRAEARLKETVRAIRKEWPKPTLPPSQGWACG